MSANAEVEIGLPGPRIDAPLLLARHAARIQTWLSEHHPHSDGYRVSPVLTAGDASRPTWRIRLQKGWLSGVEVELTTLSAAPHRAQLSVEWGSRFQSTLVDLVGYLSIPLAMGVLVASFALLRRLILAILVLAILGCGWFLAAGVLVTLLAHALSALSGDEFDAGRRNELARQLSSLPLAASPEQSGQ